MKAKAWILLLSLFICIGISDAVSSHLIKKTVKRERPCQNELIKDEVRLLVRCGSGYSFTSSHAANHFAISGFFFFFFGSVFGKYKWGFIAWAGSVALAQVYVGVHYPFDILCGSLLGLLIAKIIANTYNHFYGKVLFH